METSVTAKELHSPAECAKAIVPISEAVAQIGGKWTLHVIALLVARPMRFSELRRAIPGVSQKMLAATLRDLERDGFVTRKVTPSIPPRVDYELSAMGYELRKPLRALGQWAYANQARVQQARDDHAARRER